MISEWAIGCRSLSPITQRYPQCSSNDDHRNGTSKMKLYQRVYQRIYQKVYLEQENRALHPAPRPVRCVCSSPTICGECANRFLLSLFSPFSSVLHINTHITKLRTASTGRERERVLGMIPFLGQIDLRTQCALFFGLKQCYVLKRKNERENERSTLARIAEAVDCILH